MKCLKVISIVSIQVFLGLMYNCWPTANKSGRLIILLFFENLNVQLKQKTLELQIAELKIQQQEEKSVQEQSQMKLYAEQVSQLLATEKNLRLQLTADGEKFQQFQVIIL